MLPENKGAVSYKLELQIEHWLSIFQYSTNALKLFCKVAGGSKTALSVFRNCIGDSVVQDLSEDLQTTAIVHRLIIFVSFLDSFSVFYIYLFTVSIKILFISFVRRLVYLCICW